MDAKRSFDIVVTLTTLPIWVPALIVTALVLLVFERRPVFYVSQRVVAPGRPVRVVKFRTMINDAERTYNRLVVPVKEGVRFLNVPSDSPLYTRFGRVVERIAFTELPQLLLVLKGDMSLVGNRPLPENVMSCLRAVHPSVDGRVATPAGMTGIVQLVGRDRVTDSQRLDLENTYCRVARKANTWKLDFLILLYTVLGVMRLRRPMTVDEAKRWLLLNAGVGSFSGQASRPLIDEEEADRSRTANSRMR